MILATAEHRHLLQASRPVDGGLPRPSRNGALSTARLLCHLLEEAEQATPQAGEALYCAAYVMAGYAMNCIEAGEPETEAKA